MARITYGKTFRTRSGRVGRYKYSNGRRVGFVAKKGKTNRSRKSSYWYRGPQ